MPKKPDKATVEEIFRRLKAEKPAPETELNYTNPFTLIIAVVLSAQSTDKGVNKATMALFKIADTPQKMLNLGEDKLREHIKTVGFYNAKARNVIALSRKLLDEHGGKVPGTMEELVKLPGVGRKTANVVLNVVYGQPTMAVDTHVFRVSRRLGLSKGHMPEQVEMDLLKILPAKYMDHAHHWLILHGRYICVARVPKCEICPLNDLCPCAFKAGLRGKKNSPAVRPGKVHPEQGVD